MTPFTNAKLNIFSWRRWNTHCPVGGPSQQLSSSSSSALQQLRVSARSTHRVDHMPWCSRLEVLLGKNGDLIGRVSGSSAWHKYKFFHKNVSSLVYDVMASCCMKDDLCLFFLLPLFVGFLRVLCCLSLKKKKGKKAHNKWSEWSSCCLAGKKIDNSAP